MSTLGSYLGQRLVDVGVSKVNCTKETHLCLPNLSTDPTTSCLAQVPCVPGDFNMTLVNRLNCSASPCLWLSSSTDKEIPCTAGRIDGRAWPGNYSLLQRAECGFVAATKNNLEAELCKRE